MPTYAPVLMAFLGLGLQVLGIGLILVGAFKAAQSDYCDQREIPRGASNLGQMGVVSISRGMHSVQGTFCPRRKDGNVMRRAVVIVSTLVVLALTGFAGSAAAGGPPETPLGFVGACNMLAAWPGLGPAQGVGVQPGGGMEHAMTVDNPNGNVGMFHAVFVSGGDC